MTQAIHPPTVPQLARHRPFGVTVLVVIQVLNAIGAFFGLIPDDLSQVTQRALGSGLALVIGLVIAAGLWTLQSWAWTAAMLFAGLGLAVSITLYFRGEPSYAWMAAEVVAVLYLNQRDVQRAFQRRPRGEENGVP